MTIEKALGHLGNAEKSHNKGNRDDAEYELFWSIAEFLSVLAQQGETK